MLVSQLAINNKIGESLSIQETVSEYRSLLAVNYISIYSGYTVIKVVKMGKIIIALEDDLEKRFREEVFRRHGMKKGNLSNAISNAIELWLKTR